MLENYVIYVHLGMDLLLVVRDVRRRYVGMEFWLARRCVMMVMLYQVMGVLQGV